MAASVATGQNGFYPLDLPIGNVHNNVRCAHCNAVVVVGFLTIAKGMHRTMLILNTSAIYLIPQQINSMQTQMNLATFVDSFSIRRSPRLFLPYTMV